MENKLTSADLDALEKLEKEATPGEWNIAYGGMEGDDYAVIGSRHTDKAICNLEPQFYVPANARLIATMRNALPDLLATARREGELLALAKEMMEHMDDLGLPRPKDLDERARALGVEI